MSDDVARLARALDRISRESTDDLREMATQVAEDKLLPAIAAATPKRSGKLARNTKVGKSKYGELTFYNPIVYANTIHWGRKKAKVRTAEYTPERRSRRGRAPKARNYRYVDSPVKATKFVYVGIGRGRPAFNDELTDKITDYLEGELRHG